MGGITAVVHRRAGAVPRAVVERLSEALDHRGRDSRQVVRRPSAAYACQHLESNREDRGETQPLSGPPSEVDVLFDGRLDNRAELGRELGLAAGESARLSDARLAFLAYRRWGPGCCERFLGPFAMFAADPRERRVVCARDPLGDRSLCYHLGGEHLVVASEPAALLRHPGVSDRLDEHSLARFFAVRAPRRGATFFADVRELPPGYRLVFERDRLTVEPYWTPAAVAAVRYRRDQDYVEHFRELLTESVRCRLRAQGAPAVLMSGGLDSTSIAALAAAELRETGGGRLRTVSWVFDELPEADERRFMDPMIARFDLDAHRIRGDGEWPLRDLASWPVSANAPWQGPYCRLQQRAYSWTRASGAGVLLTGEYGDDLYLGQALWLRDLLAERRWREGWRALRAELAGRSLAGVLRAGPARGALARTLGWRGRTEVAPAWLTPRARRSLAASEEAGGRAVILDPLAAHAASLEVGHARRAGIEVRRPYRDRRLVEMLLSIPAHLVYRPGWTKWILRRAMDGILPDEVRRRRWLSSLLPLTARGLIDREGDTVGRLLAAPEALWRRYVRGDWLARAFPRRLREGRDGIETVVPWQCLCMELWQRSRRSPGLQTSSKSDSIALESP